MQAMISRAVQRLVLERLAAYPAVSLIGPRQCGKTTLARAIGGAYFDLEQEPDRLRLDLEWETLATAKRLVVLDEAQSWPVIFTRLRGAIDRDRKRRGRSASWLRLTLAHGSGGGVTGGIALAGGTDTLSLD
jgi:predicted AAA+ superfamily ATPase